MTNSTENTLAVKESRNGKFLVIDLAGRLSTTNCGELENRLIALIGQGEKEITVNCSDLNYICSSGIRIFLMALKKITPEGGSFHVCNLQANLMEIFEIAGLTSLFKIFNSVEEACR